MRKNPRHEPPSRIRYNQANPVIGVRVDRATYTRALAVRATTGISFGAVFKDHLGVVEKNIEQIRSRARMEGKAIAMKIGRREGYNEALAKHGITYACSECEEAIMLAAGSPAAGVASAALEDRGWGHASCHRRARAEQTED